MVLRSFHHIPSIPEPVKEVIAPTPSAKGLSKILAKGLGQLFPRKNKREIVAGGDVKWKPADRVAAKMLFKSPEINKPPLQTIMAKGINNTGGPMQQHSLESGPKDPGAIQRTLVKRDAEMTPMLEEKVDILKQVRASLDLATDLFRQDMVAFTKEMPAHIEKLRLWRMTMEREKDATTKSLRELRQFFLEDAHEKEMQRLNEFVRTCERLRDLAADGTLEKVADVMLKLA